MKAKSIVLAGLLLSTLTVVAATEEEDAARAEARARISPVVSAIDMNGSVAECGLKAGETYLMTWKIIAYGEDYNTSVVLFDCTDSVDFECGNNYSDSNRMLHSVVQYDQKINHDWSYTASNGTTVYAYEYDFNATIAIPTTRYWEGDGTDHGDWNTTNEGGNKVVFRFYQKDDLTNDQMPGISVLIGARAEHSYGEYSRRVYSYIATDTDPATNTCPMR